MHIKYMKTIVLPTHNKKNNGRGDVRLIQVLLTWIELWEQLVGIFTCAPRLLYFALCSYHFILKV